MQLNTFSSVAIQALQFCVAKGANVFVTSSKQDKIDRAKELGAKGGVNYKEEDWPKKLAALLPKDRPTLDAVIDSAGGNVTTQLLRVLKHGARVAVYGQCVTTQKLLLQLSPYLKLSGFGISQNNWKTSYFRHG